MAILRKDIPFYIIEMLHSVDYSKIRDADYDVWISIIKDNIGKHLSKRSKPSPLVEYYFPIRQDLCDLINSYDFSSLSLKKQMMVVPIARQWARDHLPLKRK